jgi:hypothetical protein
VAESDAEAGGESGPMAYQAPGGLWSEHGRWSRAVGLELEEGQRRALAAVPSPAEAAARQRAQRQITEDGLLYLGRCPRCRHRMQSKITFGMLVEGLHVAGSELRWTCRPSEPFRWLLRRVPGRADPEHDQHVARLTFVCSCGEAHAGRPDGASFSGCGAVWTQPALRAEGEQTVAVEAGTPQDALRAEQALALSQRSLERVRAQAEHWRAASGSLTAVLAAATLIGAPSAAHPAAATIALAVAGFLVLFYGAAVSVLAASAVSGYDHRLLAPTVLPAYERDRGERALVQVQRSMIAVFAGVLLLAGAGLAALLS